MSQSRKFEWVWNSQQSWYYESLHFLPGNIKIKIEIRRNAFDYQSYARASSFDGDKWNVIANIPHPFMQCMGVKYNQTDVKAKDFYKDEEELLTQCEMITKTH